MRLINVIRLHKKVSCAIHNCRAHDHVWVMTPVEAQRRASTFCSHRADRCVNCWRAQSSVWHLISGVISSSAALEPFSLLCMRVSNLLPIHATESTNDWRWFSLSYVIWQRQGILNLVCVKVHFCFSVLRICEAITSVDVIVKTAW